MDDPRRKGNLLATEMVGISAAVPVFVMAARDLPGAIEKWLGRKNFLARQSVLLHLDAFIRRERARLIEDSVGDLDLSDIMQDRSVTNRIRFLLTESKLRRQ